jgi:hypothetical protein
MCVLYNVLSGSRCLRMQSCFCCKKVERNFGETFFLNTEECVQNDLYQLLCRGPILQRSLHPLSFWMQFSIHPYCLQFILTYSYCFTLHL